MTILSKLNEGLTQFVFADLIKIDGSFILHFSLLEEKENWEALTHTCSELDKGNGTNRFLPRITSRSHDLDFISQKVSLSFNLFPANAASFLPGTMFSRWRNVLKTLSNVNQ